MKLIKQINDWVAIKVTLAMSTIWCVYAFLFWSLLPLVNHKLQDLVFYVSGGIIQLVALPMIMVGQNLLNAQSECRAEQDHQALMAQIEEIKDMHRDLHRVVKRLKNLDQDIDAIQDALKKDEE